MAHAQKPDLVFQRNGRVHLNRWGCQFSRLLAAEECGSADSNCIDRIPTYSGRLLATTPFASFPFTSPPVRHRVPSGSERAIQNYKGCTRWSSWLRNCATSCKVEGSVNDGVTGILHWHNPSGRTMTLGSSQLETEMITMNVTWGVKAAGA